MCAACFARLFERRAKKAVRQAGLLDPPGRVAVALSGGVASATALTILHDVTRQNREVSLHAVTVDEGRGGAARLKAAKKLCRTLGVEHAVASPRKGLGADVAAAARKAGAKKIVSGHSLDDEAASFLASLLSGADARAKKPSDSWIKPLAGAPAREVELYAKLHKIPHAGASKRERGNPLEAKVRTLLNEFERKHPDVKFNLQSSANQLSSL